MKKHSEKGKIDLIEGLDIQYNKLIGCPTSENLEALRELGQQYIAEGMPRRGKEILREVGELENRKSVPTGDIIVTADTTSGYGGTDETIPVCQIGIPVSVPVDTGSLCANG